MAVSAPRTPRFKNEKKKLSLHGALYTSPQESRFVSTPIHLKMSRIVLASGLLLLLAGALGDSRVKTCDDPSLKDALFCNSDLSIPARVRDLLPRLTAAQRIAQMGMVGPAEPDLAMEQYNFGGEALHGVWSTCAYDNVTETGTSRKRCPTQFPSPITLGASFDDRTWRAMADVTSTEARALYAHNKRLHAGGAAPAKSLEGPIGLSFYAPVRNDPTCAHPSTHVRSHIHMRYWTPLRCAGGQGPGRLKDHTRRACPGDGAR